MQIDSFSPTSSSPATTKLVPTNSEAGLVVMTNIKYFGQLISFSKTGEPKVIFQMDITDEHTATLNYIYKLKIPHSVTQYNSLEPICMQVSYDKSFIACFYFDVIDFNEPSLRNRALLFFAHPDRTLLTQVFIKFKDQIKKFIYKLQLNSYVKLKKENKEMKTEFDEYFSHSDIDNIEISENGIDFHSLTNFSQYHNELFTIFQSFPTSQYLNFIGSRAKIPKGKLEINFGPYSSLPDFMNFIENLNLEKYHLITLVESGIFFNIIFSILAGHTFVIKCNKNEILEARKLARCFASFVPFFKESQYAELNESTVAESMKYSILIVHKFPSETQGIVSLIDLVDKMYKGDSCPPRSFVYQQMEKSARQADDAFLINCYRVVKKAAGRFMLATTAISNERSDTLSILKEAGFHQDDEPIFRFWTYASINKHEARPVLTNNFSKFGVTLAYI